MTSPNRRQSLLQAALLPAALSACAQPEPSRPLRVLILGGTGLTGPHQVHYALSRGHQVTLFNRGRRAKAWPAAVEELVGDREVNDYRALQGRQWDVCIDNPSSVPHWVRDAAVVLRGRVGHFISISTISVYARDDQPGQDEDAPLQQYTGPDAMAETMAGLRKNMALYGPLKVAVENEARRQFGPHCTVLRPGLIVGPGDETDRFTYWPLRVQEGGKVLTPPLADPVKYIDARDLAEWTVRLAEQRTAGTFNAFGPAGELSMGRLLDELRAALGSTAEWIEAPQAFLDAHRVQPWSDLPLWVPGGGELAGLHRRSNARALAAGLRFRSVADTTQALMAWWSQQDDKRRNSALRAGLSRAREAELLAKLKA